MMPSNVSKDTVVSTRGGGRGHVSLGLRDELRAGHGAHRRTPTAGAPVCLGRVKWSPYARTSTA